MNSHLTHGLMRMRQDEIAAAASQAQSITPHPSSRRRLYVRLQRRTASWGSATGRARRRAAQRFA
jgi:hypothetical protein